MHNSTRAVAAVIGAMALGVLLVGCGLLLAAAVFLPLVRRSGMVGAGCPWCGGLRTIGGGEIAGILALLLVVLAGLVLLALLVLGVFWLARRSSAR
jgi:hypothetical protein